jgi:acetyltransferase EpsM
MGERVGRRFREDTDMKDKEDGQRGIVILGASFFAEEIADLVAQVGGYRLLGFVEGLERERCRKPLLGLPVYWIEDVETLRHSCRAVCAVGSPQREAFIRQARARGLEFTTVAHPSAQVSATTSLGEGCIIGAGAVIGSHTVVGRHVIVNRGALLGHHVQVGDYATVSPGANIAGRTTIGPCTYVAMGAIIVDGVSIGGNCLIAAGAVVTRDVPDGARVAGVPARTMKTAVEVTGR